MITVILSDSIHSNSEEFFKIEIDDNFREMYVDNLIIGFSLKILKSFILNKIRDEIDFIYWGKYGGYTKSDKFELSCKLEPQNYYSYYDCKKTNVLFEKPDNFEFIKNDVELFVNKLLEHLVGDCE